MGLNLAILAMLTASAVGCTLVHTRWHWTRRDCGLGFGRFLRETVRPRLRIADARTALRPGSDAAYLDRVLAGNFLIGAVHILSTFVLPG